MSIDYATLVQEHGYAITLVGSILEGEFVMLLAGLAAHRGYLNLPLVMAIGAIGATIGGQILFAFGRRYGGAMLARLPLLRPAADQVNELLARRAVWAILAVRVIYGLRTVGPAVIGMSNVSVYTFALYNAVGATIWSICFVGAGYMIGEALTTMLGHLHRIERPVAAGVVLVAIAVAVWYRWRRRRRWKRARAERPERRSPPQ